jgi:APA family basic amino acid/polyamine antiporter
MKSAFDKSIKVSGGVSILTGIMVGSGIFFVGSIVLDTLNYSPGFALLAWLFGGVLTLTYALMYAELGSKYPEVGGYYAYLKNAYHPLVGFMAGFFNFVLASSGSVAVLGLAFSEVTNNLLLTAFEVSLSNSLQIGLAALMIILFTGFNTLGIRLNTLFLKIIMGLKFIPITSLIIFGLLLGTQSISLSFDLGGVGFFEGLSLFGFAVIFTFWAYEGWTNLNNVTEEMENPKEDLPKSLIITMILVTLLYVLYQSSILRILDTGTIDFIYNEVTSFIGIPATIELVGDIGFFLVAGTIFISILGALNASILSFSRVYFAVSKDYPVLNPLAQINEKTKTPVRALLMTMGMALILLPFRIPDLISLVAFGGLVFNTLIFFSIFIFRKKAPNQEGFSVPLFPYLPYVSIFITLLLLIAIFIQNPVFSLIGTGVVLLSIPVYYLLLRFSQA